MDHNRAVPAYEALRALLFRLDPEVAHEWAMTALQKGLIRARPCIQDPVEVFGVRFPNRLGLAAGFDKNGVAISAWSKLGFGHVEVGTVTRHPQPGNPKPRLFRYPASRALINRMGFNNDGADALARRLETAPRTILIGVNLGKSKVTELDDAPGDYAYSFKLLAPLADYVVVNVSSPNTPGLRSLQEKGPLTRILWALRELDEHKPLLVKLAPDLEPSALDDLLELADDFRLSGLVATNTTLSREGLPTDPAQAGGLSGAPLQPKADQVLDYLHRARPDLPLIGVGAVLEPEDARRKLALGATLVQAYTGFVYGGPDWPSKIAAALADPR